MLSQYWASKERPMHGTLSFIFLGKQCPSFQLPMASFTASEELTDLPSQLSPLQGSSQKAMPMCACDPHLMTSFHNGKKIYLVSGNRVPWSIKTCFWV